MKDLHEIFQRYNALFFDPKCNQSNFYRLASDPNPESKRQALLLLLSFGEECLLHISRATDEIPQEFFVHSNWDIPEVHLEILDRLCYTKIWEPFIRNGFFDAWLEKLYTINCTPKDKKIIWPEGALKQRMLYISQKMIHLPRALFDMGDPKSQKTTRQQSYAYEYTDTAVSKFLVTQVLWKEFMGFVPQPHPNPMHPITHVSLFDALILCNKMSQFFHCKPVYTLNTMLILEVEKHHSREHFWVEHRHDFYHEIYPASGGFRIPFTCEWEFLAQANFCYFDEDRDMDRCINAFGVHDVTGRKNQWLWPKDTKDISVGVTRGLNNNIYQDQPQTSCFMIPQIGLRLAQSKSHNHL